MEHQSRRRFLRGSLAVAGLGLLAGCGLLPRGAPEPAKVPRIGFLSVAPQPFYEAFREGLQELGWVDGQNLTIEYRFAEGRLERLPELAAQLAQLPVDLIVAPGTALEARQATGTIPIVAPLTPDVVEQGLAASLAHPGGNVTGLSPNNIELSGKRLQLLQEASPGVARVAVLWNVADPGSGREFAATTAAAQALGIAVSSLGVRSPEDFAEAFGTARSAGAEALMALGHPLLTGRRSQVLQFAAEGHLPAIYSMSIWPESGGLMSYGPNFPDLLRRSATYVHKILKGTKPADLPIERPTKFDFVINLKTAQVLGLSIPPTILQQATEVIQ